MINARRYRARIREVAFLICLISLIWIALPAASENAQEITKDQSALNQEKKQQERRLKRDSFKSARELLIKHGVPFDPDILLEPNWKEKLAPALKVMPEFREFREGEQKMAGVHLAHTLLLPEHVELTGDTVIIARQLIFSGKDVKIKGPYDLAFFPIDPIVTLESDFLKTTSAIGASRFVKAGFSTARLLAIARERALFARPTSITINLDGLGSDEWRQKKKSAASEANTHHAARSGSTRLMVQNLDGAPGEQGAEGAMGEAAIEPSEAGEGPPGWCGAGVPNGGEGENGHDASPAGTGETGLRGFNGAAGGTFAGSVPAGDTPVNISARGGRGGQGGRGGPGGLPARGGKGGKGGPGDACPCPLLSGSGGRGGTGGRGSLGGQGGNGGPGATGGAGGNINLTVSCGFTSYIVTRVNGGDGGQGGPPGQNSAGGPPGFGGDPGPNAQNILCLDKAGQAGRTGAYGLQGDNIMTHGQEGPVGQHGPDGQYNITYSTCGGGGDECYGGDNCLLGRLKYHKRSGSRLAAHASLTGRFDLAEI